MTLRDMDDDGFAAQQIQRLCMEVIVDSLERGGFPRPSAALAALNSDHGPDGVVVALLSWLEVWRTVVSTSRPGLDRGGYVLLADQHLLLPECGGNAHARDVVHDALLDLLDHPDDPVRALVHLDRGVVSQGAAMWDECGLLVTFMVKCAIADSPPNTMRAKIVADQE